MLFSVEQAFVGREEIRAPLKTPAWEATCSQAITLQSNALLIELTYHGSNCGVCVLQELSLRETLNCVLTAIKILSGQG